MCPACMASAAMMIASVISTGGLTAVIMKKLGAKNRSKKSIQNQNSKEE